MNIVAYHYCKALYELSGWNATPLTWTREHEFSEPLEVPIPAYDEAFLVAKDS